MLKVLKLMLIALLMGMLLLLIIEIDIPFLRGAMVGMFVWLIPWLVEADQDARS